MSLVSSQASDSQSQNQFYDIYGPDLSEFGASLIRSSLG